MYNDKNHMLRTKKNEKSNTAMLRAKTGSMPAEDEGIVPPRAQKFNRFLGQQIRIEINQHQVDQEELNTNHAETQTLLFYDFNAGARQFIFGTHNTRLATRGEFRRTGMAGAQFVDKNVIEIADEDQNQNKRRPITSHFRGGDRLPSRAAKTRERAKRIRINPRKNTKRQQQGVLKNDLKKHESMSPKNSKIYEMNNNHRQRLDLRTAVPNKQLGMFEDLNTENTEPDSN